MTTEEAKAALEKLIDDASYKQDLVAAYAIYAEDVVFQMFPFPPVVDKEANMQADASMLAAFSDVRCPIDELGML